jgi:hypothetical protein
MLGSIWRRVAPVLAIAVLTLSLAGHAHAAGDDLAELSAKVEELLDALKHAEALPLAERAVKLAEAKHGPEDPAVAGPLLTLGRVHFLTTSRRGRRAALQARPRHPGEGARAGPSRRELGAQ